MTDEKLNELNVLRRNIEECQADIAFAEQALKHTPDGSSSCTFFIQTTAGSKFSGSIRLNPMQIGEIMGIVLDQHRITLERLKRRYAEG